MDYVDELLQNMGVSGDGDDDEQIGALVEVGAVTPQAARAMKATPKNQRGMMIARVMKNFLASAGGPGGPLPSPPFARSGRNTERRAPLGFTEEGSGAKFFTLAAVVGAITTMRAKVSREAHVDRLLIVPSGPGAVIQSIFVGDEEQVLASGCPVELYSSSGLADTVPDNFSPLGPALDFVVVLLNTTAVAITGTIGTKASVKR